MQSAEVKQSLEKDVGGVSVPAQSLARQVEGVEKLGRSSLENAKREDARSGPLTASVKRGGDPHTPLFQGAKDVWDLNYGGKEKAGEERRYYSAGAGGKPFHIGREVVAELLQKRGGYSKAVRCGRICFRNILTVEEEGGGAWGDFGPGDEVALLSVRPE